MAPVTETGWWRGCLRAAAAAVEAELLFWKSAEDKCWDTRTVHVLVGEAARVGLVVVAEYRRFSSSAPVVDSPSQPHVGVEQGKRNIHLRHPIPVRPISSTLERSCLVTDVPAVGVLWATMAPVCLTGGTAVSWPRSLNTVIRAALVRRRFAAGTTPPRCRTKRASRLAWLSFAASMLSTVEFVAAVDQLARGSTRFFGWRPRNHPVCIFLTPSPSSLLRR